jgi:hypothetical protein
MKRPRIFIGSILISCLAFCCNSILFAQSTETDSALSAVEILKVRTTIESIENQFSKDFLDGDSMALA